MSKLSLISILMVVIAVNCKDFSLGYKKAADYGAPGDYEDSKEHPVKEEWFLQKLDHFNQTDLRTWNQRYFVNVEYCYKPSASSLVFLMLGGEGQADPNWMVKGAMVEYAKNFGAMCIMLEHRYYGASQPTSDLSVENLVYLSSKQALADVANFIANVNEAVLPKGTKWIVFGGSYSGSLSAWMRLKYPHLVYGAVSSSGPLLAKVDFDKYYRVVVEALREKTGNDDCANRVKEAHKEIQSLITTSPEVVEKEFKVCTSFSKASANDISNFYNSIADDFADVVQYNEDNRSINNKTNDMSIASVCKLLTEPGPEPAHSKLGKFNSMVLDENKQTCLDYNYSKMIDYLKNPSWFVSKGGRQWMYQTCTEFGFFQTSSAEVNIFGNTFPIDFFIQQCEDIFGEKFNKKFVYDAAHWTNTYYGGLDIEVGRVIYVHGSIDPWHILGITDAKQVKEKDVKVIFINGTAHCANMYPTRASDLPALHKARSIILQTLTTWA